MSKIGQVAALNTVPANDYQPRMMLIDLWEGVPGASAAAARNASEENRIDAHQ